MLPLEKGEHFLCCLYKYGISADCDGQNIEFILQDEGNAAQHIIVIVGFHTNGICIDHGKAGEVCTSCRHGMLFVGNFKYKMLGQFAQCVGKILFKRCFYPFADEVACIFGLLAAGQGWRSRLSSVSILSPERNTVGTPN